MPDFIVLQRDEGGRPIIPTSRVTALAEAREAWATELGTLDAVTRSITRGQLVMPLISAPSQQTVLCNHPSWENDEDAKRALWQVIAKWLASGVLEYVAWESMMGRQHAHLAAALWSRPQGLGAALSAHHGRSIRQQALFRLGVTYTTTAQLSSTLNPCDFHFSVDISDAYHLALWAGCGGELRPIRRPVITSCWPVLVTPVAEAGPGSGSAPGGPYGAVEGVWPGAGPAGGEEDRRQVARGSRTRSPGNTGTRAAGDPGPAGWDTGRAGTERAFGGARLRQARASEHKG